MRLRIEDLKGHLIDAHTHLGFSTSGLFSDKLPNCFDIVSLLSNLQAHGFSYAIVHPFPSYYCRQRPLNEEVGAHLRVAYEQVPYLLQNKRIVNENQEIALGKLIVFPMFSMNYAIDEQISFLEQAVLNGDIYGLKYYSDSDANEISQIAHKGKPFIDFALKHNLPITFHTSEVATIAEHGLSNAMDVLNLALEIPGLRVSIAHMAHFSRRVLLLAEKLSLPNLFFDLSPLLHLCNVRRLCTNDKMLSLDYSTPKSVLRFALNTFPCNVLWGSDMPFNFTCNLNNPAHTKTYKSFAYKANVDLLDDSDKQVLCNRNVIRYMFGGCDHENQD